MRFVLFSHLQNARDSLRSNRMRSLLTMVGVAIGIASITAILALSDGASMIVSDQVEALGGNLAVIRPVSASDGLNNLGFLQAHRNFAASTLTEADIISVKNIPQVEATVPLMVLSGMVKAKEGSPSDIPIVATTPDLALVDQLEARDGQFIDETTAANTAAIGVQLSIDLFGTEQSIGKTFSIRGDSFTVIGVLKRLNNPINYNAVDFDRAAIISIESGKKLNQGVLQIQQINVCFNSVANLGKVIAKINQTLLQNHDGEHDFVVLSNEQISQPTSQLFYTIAGVMVAIAGISLLVGGVGIMNIMLVGVAERTREIGVRKALGASRNDIAWQFLIESLVLSIGGGMIGYIIGYLLAFGASTFLTFDPVVNWSILGIALGISVFTGTIFGFYPAVRAARKDPIESLRQYD
jgi:ABC-type antimicrobial peptide transport system permease subunit